MWKDFFQGLVSPITGLISEAIVDKDKANELIYKVQELLDGAAARADAYATELLKAKTSIILAEAHGTFLQRSWRPLMMLWFAVLIGLWWFGIEPEGMTQEDKNNLFGLLKLGIGGYVVGRSAEKTIPKAIEAFKK